MTDYAYDAGSERDEEERRREAGRIEAADRRVLEEWMGGQEGRYYMLRFLDKCHIYQGSFTAGEPDTTAYKLGEEHIGKQLMLDLIRFVPELYAKMMAEENLRQENRRAKAEKRAKEADEQGTLGV
jgi:hypothetical protein